MKNNQQGFTYPLTLCLIILFLLFFSFRVEQLLTDRKMAHEKETILKEDYYILSSVKKTEGIFQTGGTIPAKGKFTFVFGSMDFQAEAPAGSVKKVNFTLNLKSGETIIGRGFFDTKSKKLIKWAEMK
ncbi:competence type IV pilus minor pilin ComGG [Neobacillus soli]|uniref:competence type IV pilus minor pilin ComGG n=1 Tax=Neobacillus soli TaxID=220688 RepID=UPI0008260046|nr:competence type IV pilus minor pilin ComGG [Neobacillus soli]